MPLRVSIRVSVRVLELIDAFETQSRRYSIDV